MNAATLRHLAHQVPPEPAPLFKKRVGASCRPPVGWATAWRLKHGGPTGHLPRHRRPALPAKEVA